METKSIDIDHYANHLANANAKNKIIAVESIYNKFGVLLVPEGAALEQRVVEFLTGHKMQKQLDDMISIERCLTSASLALEFDNFLEKYPDLNQIHQKNNFHATLEHLCTVQQIPRILLQKLTVLKVQLPEVFKQTLFSTWLACLLAKEMKLLPNQLRNIFYVGLLHDLGMLHINPELISKQGDFTEQEWQSVKQHMIISLAIAKHISEFDDEVYKGIMQHHERWDGTGYPKGLKHEQLSYSGQLIGLADILCHIRTRQFCQSGKSMANIMPYIQINSLSFKHEYYQAMYTVIHRSQLDIATLLDRKDFLKLPTRLIKQRTQIDKLHQELGGFIELLPREGNRKYSKTLLEASQQIADTLKRTGLCNTETINWLESINKDDYAEAHAELQEYDALQYELLWLFKKACRIINDLIRTELSPNTDNFEQLTRLSATIQKDLLQAWTDYN